MKKNRIVALLLVVVMSAALLTGCGGLIPAKALVQGNLDAVYLGKYSDEYLKLVDSDKAQAEKDYESGIENEVEYFAQYFSIDLSMCSDSTKEKIADMYRQIYSKSKYEVGDQSNNGDTYLVELTVYPIDIFDKVINEDADDFDAKWQARIDAGEFDEMSDAEIMDAWALAIVEFVSERIPNIGYLEPQTISVQIKTNDDDTYSIDSGDFQRIDSLIIQY